MHYHESKLVWISIGVYILTIAMNHIMFVFQHRTTSCCTEAIHMHFGRWFFFPDLINSIFVHICGPKFFRNFLFMYFSFRFAIAEYSLNYSWCFNESTSSTDMSAKRLYTFAAIFFEFQGPMRSEIMHYYSLRLVFWCTDHSHMAVLYSKHEFIVWPADSSYTNFD